MSELTVYANLNILGLFLLNDSPKHQYNEYDDAKDCENYYYYDDLITNNQYNELTIENKLVKEEVKDVKDVKDQRDMGFFMLSNPEKVSNHLKKTKFCQVLIDKGHCNRAVCNFAHSLNEIVFPECAFRDNCRKKNVCKFKHPSETNDIYKKRINFIVPSNII
jgi:hypothetical protein